MQPHLFPCASSSAAASFPALTCTVKLFTAPGPFWKEPAILKINKINKTNQSQHDCPRLLQIEQNEGRLCNPRSFGDRQLMLAPSGYSLAAGGPWGCPDGEELLTATFLPGPSGVPHASELLGRVCWRWGGCRGIWGVPLADRMELQHSQ